MLTSKRTPRLARKWASAATRSAIPCPPVSMQPGLPSRSTALPAIQAKLIHAAQVIRRICKRYRLHWTRKSRIRIKNTWEHGDGGGQCGIVIVQKPNTMSAEAAQSVLNDKEMFLGSVRHSRPLGLRRRHQVTRPRFCASITPFPPKDAGVFRRLFYARLLSREDPCGGGLLWGFRRCVVSRNSLFCARIFLVF